MSTGSDRVWGTRFLLLLVSGFTGALCGCATEPPNREYVIARAALQAARAHEAQRFASGQLLDAEQAFKTGEKAYADESYATAKDEFNLCRRAAEKAEVTARIQKFKTGEAP